MTEERLARICVSSFPGFGSKTLRMIGEAFSEWQDAWIAPLSAFLKIGVRERTASRFVDWRRTFDFSQMVETLASQSIATLFPDDAEYPSSLRASNDPPEILFVRGTLADRPAISVVGTRKMTSYGERCVESIVTELAQSGFAIVSGLALGIDGVVHRAALGVGGTTIAVLGTGIDDATIYPREHCGLAYQMISHQGAIVSEFPPGTDSRKEHFPIRNRIIAGWSLATVVIEATQKSGSLITAKLALEDNRMVLAVPGPIWSAQSIGTNQLIKLGAHVCTSAQDVIDAVAFDRPDLAAKTRALLPIDPLEQSIIDVLDEPQHVDEIGRATGLDPAAVASHLAVMELKGLAKPIGGQMWVRGR